MYYVLDPPTWEIQMKSVGFSDMEMPMVTD
jgi:hypothetical protein